MMTTVPALIVFIDTQIGIIGRVYVLSWNLFRANIEFFYIFYYIDDRPNYYAVVIPTMGEKYGSDNIKGYWIVAAGTPEGLEKYLQFTQFNGHPVEKMSIEEARALTGYSFFGW